MSLVLWATAGDRFSVQESPVKEMCGHCSVNEPGPSGLMFYTALLRSGADLELHVMQVSGSPTEFPKTKEQYVNWGDMEEDGERGSRFRGEPLEPHTKPLA